VDPPNAGYLNVPGYKAGNFTFFLESDDGSLLTIDGKVVISDPGAVMWMQLMHPSCCHALLSPSHGEYFEL